MGGVVSGVDEAPVENDVLTGVMTLPDESRTPTTWTVYVDDTARLAAGVNSSASRSAGHGQCAADGGRELEG